MPTDQSERFHDQPAGTKRKFSGTLRNVIFHAAGATFVLACTLLFIHASTRGTPWHTIGCLTYPGDTVSCRWTSAGWCRDEDAIRRRSGRGCRRVARTSRRRETGGGSPARHKRDWELSGVDRSV